MEFELKYAHLEVRAVESAWYGWCRGGIRVLDMRQLWKKRRRRWLWRDVHGGGRGDGGGSLAAYARERRRKGKMSECQSQSHWHLLTTPQSSVIQQNKLCSRCWREWIKISSSPLSTLHSPRRISPEGVKLEPNSDGLFLH